MKFPSLSCVPLFAAKSMPNLFEDSKEKSNEVAEESDEKTADKEVKVVLVPQADDETFHSFYSQSTPKITSASDIKVSSDDFDELFLNSADM